MNLGANRSTGLVAGLLLGFGAAATDAEAAASCGDIYQGANVTLMTSFSPGAGGDRTTRLLGEMLTKHLPGNPPVKVENRAGGAHGVGANYFARNAEPDGMTVFYTNSNVLRTFVAGGDAITYDPREFAVIAGMSLGNRVLVIRPEVLDNVENPSAEPVIVGDTNGIRGHVPVTLIAADYLGYNLKWNYGYEGGDDLILAMLRGEIDIYGSINRADLKNLIDEGAAVPWIQDGDERAEDFPDIPTLNELLAEKGAELTPEDQAAYDNWLAPELSQHLFFAPGGTSDDILTCLRDTFVEITEDPEFDEKLAVALTDQWLLVPAEAATKIVKDASTVDDALTAHLREIRRAHGLPTD
jgi:tripartite-type tricarboxylate transporter receptor subunit TctC